MTKRLRTSAKERGSLVVVVKGSSEESLLEALDVVWGQAAELDPLFSPNYTNLSPLPGGKLSLVVDLKGEPSLHAQLLEMLADELPDKVVLTAGGGNVYDLIPEWKGVLLEARVLSEASGEPWQLGGRPMPPEWGLSVAESLAEMSDRGEVLCCESGDILFQAAPEQAYTWLETLRAAQGVTIIGGFMAVVVDNQVINWTHGNTSASLGVYGAADVDAAERILTTIVERLNPLPLAATIGVRSGHAVHFDDVRYHGEYTGFEVGPELHRKFITLGPTQWLPPAVAHDVGFRLALESSGLEFDLDGRLLRLGTASDWTNQDVRDQYQRLAEADLRPWKAFKPLGPLGRTTRMRVDLGDELFEFAEPPDRDTVPPRLAAWFADAEEVPLSPTDATAADALIERFAERLVRAAQFDPTSLSAAVQQTKVGALRSSNGSLHLVLESSFWLAGFYHPWDGTTEEAGRLIDDWSEVVAAAARQQRLTVGPTHWD